MTISPSLRWRLPVLLAGILIVLGGPRHPGGSMAQMLADPEWIPAHVLMLAGFVALLAGLILFRRAGALPDRTARFLRYATFAAALQTVEMVVHTLAFVDHANVVAGRTAPVLFTHLGLAVVAYPLFALALIGLIVAGARDRTLGSWWVAWLGIAGVAAHGIAAPAVVLGAGERFRVLFAGAALFALWLVLAALWPARGRAGDVTMAPAGRPGFA
jgi:hypothetical protein